MLNNELANKILNINSQKHYFHQSKENAFLTAFNNSRKLEEALLSIGLLETVVAKIISEVYNCPLITAGEIFANPKAVKKMPKGAAIRLNVLPLSFEDDVLTVAISDPSNADTIEELKLVSKKLKFHIATKTELANSILNCYNLYTLLKSSNEEKLNTIKNPINLVSDNNIAGDFIKHILSVAISEEGSDIHFEPLDDRTRVRYRIDGTLSNLLNFPKELHSQIITKIKIDSGINISERRLPQDGRMFYFDDGVKVDIRVSTLPTIYGEKVVLRLLKQDMEQFKLEDLGFDNFASNVLNNAIKCDSGLILIVGPTGSGKSTTLHALMEKLNDNCSNIISIEDPVEYTLKGINQVQVNEKINLSFSNILRSVLRQDPDKIMIGEIRDFETAELAIRAALTGHLVLSTLHADDTVGAINRLIDMGIQPYLLAPALKYIVAQRLVGKLCPNCREEFSADSSLLNLLGVNYETTAARAIGCDQCRHTGIKGRTVITEALALDNSIRDMIINRAPTHEILNYAIKNGMLTLKDSLINKILSLEISAEEIYLFDM